MPALQTGIQSAQLAEKLDEILDQLIAVDVNPFHVPTSTPLELVDNEEREPVEEQFRAGVMSLGCGPTTAQIVIEAYPLAEVEADDDGFLEEEDETDPAEVLRVRMPVGTARAFAKRTREVVGAGRPICVICVICGSTPTGTPAPSPRTNAGARSGDRRADAHRPHHDGVQRHLPGQHR